MSKCFNKECDYCKDNECRFGREDNAGCHWYIGEPLKEPLSKKFQDYAEEELPKLREQIKQKDQRIAELEKENNRLNTKLEIWNRFDKEDYIHRGEKATERDYYYYTNGVSTVLENEVERLNHDLAVRDKVLRLLANETNLCHENGIDGIISCYLAQAEKELKGGKDE